MSAAHANKKWTGLMIDISKVIAGTHIQMVVDQKEKMEIEKDGLRRTRT